MRPAEAIKTCLDKYVTFSGRASRAEYWWFLLLYLVVATIPVIQVLIPAMTVPLLAVSWRRMHDIGKHGRTTLVPLAPVPLIAADMVTGGRFGIPSLIGGALCMGAAIYVVVLLASDGAGDENRFGPSPVE